MKSTSTTNRTEYYKISSFIFLYFFTWSASIGLLAIWLGQKANLSGSVIGTVFARWRCWTSLPLPVWRSVKR